MIYTLYKKELGYYINNPIGYIIVALFGFSANFLFVKDIFLIGSASLRPFFMIVPWLLMIFIPAISMRILSEEKRTNTLETLLTLPISETQVVIAKFLAILTVVVAALVTTMSLPVSLYYLSGIYIPEVLVGYLGVICLSASFIALSIFFSSQTKNQVIALLSSIIVIFLLMVVASDFSATVLPRFILDALSVFSPLYHVQNFMKGLLDLRSLFYFIGLTFLFLFLTIIDLEKRA